MRTLAPARSQVNMIESRKREHSRKPDEQYALIEACSPGPYLELFARRRQPGWVTWGDESDAAVTPRGKAHRGYAGGEMRVPHIDPHVRMADRLADTLSATLRERYERGTSIRTLATETGYSTTRVRGLLERSGTALRGSGRVAQADALF